MSLPAVVEIAIGLLFIYLTLSLLTSEIQELIAVLLQWRAEHLKKSIANLFAGEPQAIRNEFISQFYESPLIQALNQEGQGGLESFWRNITHALARFWSRLTQTQRILGSQNSAPSYIPAETFSVALMQALHIQSLSQKASELTARKIVQVKLTQLSEILADLRHCSGDPSILAREFSNLQRSLDAMVEDLVRGRISLAICLEQTTEQLARFVDHTEALLADPYYRTDPIRKRLPYLRQLIVQPPFEPTIAEVLQTVLDAPCLPVQLSPPANSLTNVLPERSIDPPSKSGLPQQQSVLAAMRLALEQEHPDWLEQATQIPPSLKQNLYSLAEQACLKTSGLENQVRQLEQELAVWFNRSMDRASGVYRRNAKGIALLIGFLTATLINADTFHMVDRLSKDSLIRTTISQTAEQSVRRNRTAPPAAPSAASPPSTTPQAELVQVREAVNTALEELPLPVGWHPANLQPEAGQPSSVVWLKRLLGWLITGVALSMGAAFWYDLLQKVMQVRGTGRKPERE